MDHSSTIKSSDAEGGKSPVPKKIRFSSNEEMAQEDIAHVDLNDQLKCPVCTELCTRPRECNACGRFFCAACIAHLTSCPLCRKEPFLSRESRFAARVVDSVRVNCAHCKTPVVRSRLEEHQKTCAARVRKCTFRGCGLVAINKEKALEHVVEAHGNELWEHLDHLSQIIVSGGISFQLEEGRSVAVLDSGKMLMSTMKKVYEPNAYGRTQNLSTFTSESLSLKFKLVHYNSEKMQFGLVYNYTNNQPVVFVVCTINKSTSLITCEKDDKKTLSKVFKLPINLDDANAEYCVEVSRESRTIRFLMNGEQLHDGDIPIPLSKEQLNNSCFTVCLFAPGDCVRICD